MAYCYSINQNATCPGYMFEFLSTLIAAGWHVKGYGDGISTFSNSVNLSSNPFGSGNSGAGNLGNYLAWFRVQQPTVTGSVTGFNREIIMQIGSPSYELRIKYSPGSSGGFNQLPVINTSGARGSAVSASVTPSALDEVTWIYSPANGVGYDTAPSFIQLLDGDNQYRFHCVAGGATENYTFYWAGTLIDQPGFLDSAFALEVMQPGSFTPQDLDPAILYMEAFTSEIFGGGFSRGGLGCNAGSPQGFMGGISGGTYQYNEDAGIAPNLSQYWVNIFALFYDSYIKSFVKSENSIKFILCTVLSLVLTIQSVGINTQKRIKN